MHNETLSVIAVSVRDPDCSPFAIERSDVAVTPTSFAEIVSDDFPLLHTLPLILIGLRRER